MGTCVCVPSWMYLGKNTSMEVRGKLWKWILLVLRAALEYRTRVIKLGSKSLHPLSHLGRTPLDSLNNYYLVLGYFFCIH